MINPLTLPIDLRSSKQNDFLLCFKYFMYHSEEAKKKKQPQNDHGTCSETRQNQQSDKCVHIRKHAVHTDGKCLPENASRMRFNAKCEQMDLNLLLEMNLLEWFVSL